MVGAVPNRGPALGHRVAVSPAPRTHQERPESMSSLTLERESSHTLSTRPPRAGRAPGHPQSGGVRGACAPAPCPDRQALLRTLYHDHAAALRSYVTRLLDDAHQAEDVVQE